MSDCMVAQHLHSKAKNKARLQFVHIYLEIFHSQFLAFNYGHTSFSFEGSGYKLYGAPHHNTPIVVLCWSHFCVLVNYSFQLLKTPLTEHIVLISCVLITIVFLWISESAVVPEVWIQRQKKKLLEAGMVEKGEQSYTVQNRIILQVAHLQCKSNTSTLIRNAGNKCT